MNHFGHEDHSGHGGHDDHSAHAGQNHGAMDVITSTVASIVEKSMEMTMGDHSNHMGHAVPDMNGHDDHGGLYHGDHSESSGGHHMMQMYFHGGYNEIVLFESWTFSTIGGLIGSMVGIFFMAAFYEGLKYYREYLFWKTYNALQYRSVAIPAEKGVVSEDNQVVHMVGEVIHKQPPTMFSWMHGFQTFLHMVQIVLSYFLMLIFMTYNVWLCLAVVLGAGVGYFLFGWKKSVIVDVTEHCH